MPYLYRMKIALKKTPATRGALAVVAKTNEAMASHTTAQHQAAYAAFTKRGGKGWLAVVDDTGNDVYLHVAPSEKKAVAQAEAHRKMGAALSRLLNAAKHSHVSLVTDEATVLEGLLLANYTYLELFGQKRKEKAPALASVDVIGLPKATMIRTEKIVEAVCMARDLINKPVNFLNAEDLAKAAQEEGKKCGFSVEVFSKKKIETLKMGGLLGVNWGSIDVPTFSILEYKPKTAVNKKPYVLVGKGVVYDTGGLSLKPTSSMDTMKSDMSGAAAVIGTLRGAAQLGLPVHVIGLIPATDNRPGGNAVTPGDVLTMSDGTTVEVMNTDAEGRLILADALHYAKRYHPQLVIDLATLTGAAARAIGPNATVAMGNADESYWNDLMAAGEAVHERLVRFPFWDEYNDLLKSDIADLKNIGGADAGAITAGKFLEHFTDYPYIHLDIAGPAFVSTPSHYWTAGGTGIGIRLLLEFLRTRTS